MANVPEGIKRKNDMEKINGLTSFDYFKYAAKDSKDNLEEKTLLYQACRYLEDDLVKVNNAKLEATKDGDQNDKLFRIYVHLGHVNLLALDYSRALSAYQKGYKLKPDDFWKEPEALYGLGLTYFHFRAFKAAIQLFCELLYCHPFVPVSTDTYARLGVAFKCVDNLSQSLKHLSIALADTNESKLLPRYQIRFQIAHCYDCANDFRRANVDYLRLLKDHEAGTAVLPREYLAAVYRHLVPSNCSASFYTATLSCQFLRTHMRD
jgi:tetratricopeptide (TPR) repeat protein